MLTAFQKQKLPRLFALHDLDRDGVLTRANFEEYAQRIASTRGWGSDSAEHQALRAHFLTFWVGLEQTASDAGAARVTLAEWLDYWDRILGIPDMYDDIIPPIARMVFTILDQDGDGSVTAGEYAAIYTQGGLDASQAPAAFARLDLNNDGKLSVNEVTRLADQFFRSEDPAEPGNALFGPVPGVELRA